MKSYFDKELPESVRRGQRLTTMTSGQARFPIAPSIYKFKQYGPSGAWISELLPYTAKMANDIAIVKTVWTEAINHDPAITYITTGDQLPGKASLGAWLNYGLNVMRKPSMPAYGVMAFYRQNFKALPYDPKEILFFTCRTHPVSVKKPEGACSTL